MKVNELIEKYEKNPRIDLVKNLEIVPYISIEYKRQLAKLVLDNCTSVVDGEIHIDSVERYLLFTISVIGMHTNLEFSRGEDEEYSVLDDYDALCESGLLVKIIDTFKDDYASCQEILNMMTTDRLQDSMTIEKKIYNFLDSLKDMLSNGVNNITNNFNTDLLKDLNPENLEKLYNFVLNQE